MPDSKFSTFPVLKTNRLLLRKLKNKDFREIRMLRSDERVNKYLDRIPATSDKDAVEFINKILEGEFLYWGIALRETDLLVGTICLFDISEKEKKAEIGFELNPSYQGKGLMREAVGAVLAFCFTEMKLDRITAFVHKNNLRSIALLQKNKFQLATEMADKNHTDSKDFIYYSLSRTQG